MTDIEIVHQALNGYHLNKKELERLKTIISQLKTVVQ